MTDPSEWHEERQHRWEPVAEPPDGWRRPGATWLSDDGERYVVLWTDAPAGESPHQHGTFFQQHRRITQRRYVTPWTDVVADEATK